MVRAYGMSEELGPLSFDRGRPLFLEVPWRPPKDYSEETAKKMDEEIKTIITESYKKAKSIIKERLEHVKKIANLLLEKEIIEGDELIKLLEE